MLQAEQRVTVVAGPLKGSAGTVIKDMRLRLPEGAWHPAPHDVVWVLLDDGDNPQRFPSRELAVR